MTNAQAARHSGSSPGARTGIKSLTMKLLGSMVLLTLVLMAGCVRRYEITLANQRKITTHGKPKVDKKLGTVRYKDVEGQVHVIPTFTIQEIAPH